jgi:hypothetical protein
MVGVFWYLTMAKTMTTKMTTTKLTTNSAKAHTKITNDPSTTPRPHPAPNITPTATALDITNPTMMNLRSSGGKAKDMVRELEKIRQMNKRNYQMQRQREEEEEKRQKDAKAATPVEEDKISIPLQREPRCRIACLWGGLYCTP